MWARAPWSRRVVRVSQVILHANWSSVGGSGAHLHGGAAGGAGFGPGLLHVWAEVVEGEGNLSSGAGRHGMSLGSGALLELLGGLVGSGMHMGVDRRGELRVLVPAVDGKPLASAAGMAGVVDGVVGGVRNGMGVGSAVPVVGEVKSGKVAKVGKKDASGALALGGAEEDEDFAAMMDGEFEGEQANAEQVRVEKAKTEPVAPVVVAGHAPGLLPFGVETVVFGAEDALAALLTIAERVAEREQLGEAGADGVFVRLGAGFQYFAAAARYSKHLLAQQRFVPMLVQLVTGETRGAWHPWMSDEKSADRAVALVVAMPAPARCVPDHFKHDPWAITEDFVTATVNAECRKILTVEQFVDSIAERDPLKDPHVAWLSGLLSREERVPGTPPVRQEMAKRVRGWIGILEDRGASTAWRLLLRLSEPEVKLPGGVTKGKAKAAQAQTPEVPLDPNDPAWAISFHLQNIETPSLVVDAEDVWLLTGDTASVMGKRMDQPQNLLLGELGRASRYYRVLEEALEENRPERVFVNTKQAYEFLREVRPILLEQGFGVDAPDWWDSPKARLGAKLRLDAGAFDPFSQLDGGLTNAARAQVGLSALVNYQWEIAVGDMTLSLNEFEQLAAKRVPLVRINGRWVEIRPEDVQAAIKFIRDNPGGQIKLADAMRLAYGSDLKQTGIPVVGMEANGWLQGFLNSESNGGRSIDTLPPPKDFRGTLRPYQARGVSWMSFQEQLGFGVCLADDMGLGKTVQLLALLSYEREKTFVAGPGGGGESGRKGPPLAALVPLKQEAADLSKPVPLTEMPDILAPLPEENQPTYELLEHGVAPTLLLVPMSVVGNWIHETKRFCPHLKVLMHHGIERLQGEAFFKAAHQSDIVITTYSLANRDKNTLGRIRWGRVVLDEAQYIKNPTSKQSQAVRAITANHKVALTGTPVENRLTELWSIMDFLNPGYLGGAHSFRGRFAVPIERYRDRVKGEQLRGLIKPFILRRLKSDPTVVADLPEKLESREYGHLTSEQASLYENCVKRMLSEVDDADGMQRRGLVLSALIRLKQICNHPSLVLKDAGLSGGNGLDVMGNAVMPLKGTPDRKGISVDPSRSGKCIRLLEMLEEVLSEGDQSLVFTQFRTMGHLLESMIREKLLASTGREVLFIHGGTTQQQRQAMIDKFQRGDGQNPVLILSLRAGGVGLNLTAATHVFHFDRWWNPAVENQATDRAYRIGQTRTVQVHKFVVRGTLEERIDQMIESKTELAQNIIGNGEQWLSEMTTDQLREILTLRNDTVDDEA